MTLVMMSLHLALEFQCLFPLCADWRKSDSSVVGERQGNWRWNSDSRDVVVSSPSFSRPAIRAPQRANARRPIPGMPYSRRSRWLDVENFTS